MTAHCIPRLAPLYFIEHQSPRVRGPWFLELDRDRNSRKAVIELIRSGEVDPVKVLEVDEAEGTVHDVTADIIAEADAANYSHALNSAFSFVNQALFEIDHRRDLRKNEVV